MAKKKVAKKATTKKTKKKVPAPGQKNLAGVESDRDPELDKAAVEVAEKKRERLASKEWYDDAVAKMGELMQKKKINSYTSAGLNFTVAHEDRVKVSKAKD